MFVINQVRINPTTREALAAMLQARGDAFNELAGYCIGNSLDDLVRSDQPDLSNKRSGAFRGGAGRVGPADRRWINHRYH